MALASPRPRKPKKPVDALRGTLVSIALALTPGQVAAADSIARTLGTSRRSYLGECLITGMAMLMEGDVSLGEQLVSGNAMFLSIRIEREAMARLDRLVALHSSNRRWIATAAVLAGQAERRRTGEDPEPSKANARLHHDERIAALERRVERLEHILAERQTPR
jgi:hypothetical protein